MKESPTYQRLTYLTVLLGMLAYFEQITFYAWFPTVTGQIYILAVIIAFCQPGSVLVFMFLVLAGFVHLFYSLPFILNHLFFEFLMYTNILILFGYFCFKQRTWVLDADGFYQAIAPILRIGLCSIYLFAFLAKLNPDFLDVHYSCAAQYMRLIQKAHPFLLHFPWMPKAAIWGTMIVESTLPVLLFFRPTRHFAILYGIVFHYTIAFIPRREFFSFSSLMIGMYFLFLSDAAFAHIRHLGHQFTGFLDRHLPTRLIRYAFISVLVILPQYINYAIAHDVYYWFNIWLVLEWMVVAIYIYAIYRSRREPFVFLDFQKSFGDFFPRPLLLLLLIIPWLFNGLSTYVGLRTGNTLSMFSNLGVFGRTHNHFIFPPSIVVFKQELIKILQSNRLEFNYYRQHRKLITAFEFRRLANQLQGNWSVVCLYQGTRIVLHGNGTSLGHPLLKPIPWIEQKFLWYKPVDEGEHCLCDF